MIGQKQFLTVSAPLGYVEKETPSAYSPRAFVLRVRYYFLSRRATLRILPLVVRGSSFTKSMTLGYL